MGFNKIPEVKREDTPSSSSSDESSYSTGTLAKKEDKPSSSVDRSTYITRTPENKEAKKSSGPLALTLLLEDGSKHGEIDSSAYSERTLAVLEQQIKKCKNNMEGLKKEMNTLKERQIKEREKQMKGLQNVVTNLLLKVRELEANDKTHLTRKGKAHLLIEAAKPSATASKEQLMSVDQLPKDSNIRKRKSSDGDQSPGKRQKK
ncbi:uncharacterized protein LOC131219946 [Magnolia sinica]|uniref:uncharacterized protein LOC131219946 n=1 Tax=Magnolia sinica TaxID=86752 RepID=UPI002657F52B|nr:uncharacterized protein LOC131219946 [Magnolia sinica]